MNIFLIDEDPIVAANHLIDMHQLKMIVESSQLLGSAMIENGYDGTFELHKVGDSHLKHPSFLSLRNNHSLIQWVGIHSLELCRIYKERTGKTHKCHEKLVFVMENYKSVIDNSSTQFLDACDKYNGLTGDHITNYRLFYVNSKICIASWNRGTQPVWFSKLLFSKEDSVYFLNKRNKTRKNKIPMLQLESNISQYLAS